MLTCCAVDDHERGRFVKGLGREERRRREGRERLDVLFPSSSAAFLLKELGQVGRGSYVVRVLWSGCSGGALAARLDVLVPHSRQAVHPHSGVLLGS